MRKLKLNQEMPFAQERVASVSGGVRLPTQLRLTPKSQLYPLHPNACPSEKSELFTHHGGWAPRHCLCVPPRLVMGVFCLSYCCPSTGRSVRVWTGSELSFNPPQGLAHWQLLVNVCWWVIGMRSWNLQTITGDTPFP